MALKRTPKDPQSSWQIEHAWSGTGEGIIKLIKEKIITSQLPGAERPVLGLARRERTAGGTVVSAVRTNARCGVVPGGGQAGVERGLGAVYALNSGGSLGEVDDDGCKGGRSRRGRRTRWGHRRLANDNSVLTGDPREIRNKKVNKFSKHEVKGVPNVRGRTKVIFGLRGEPAGEGTAEVGERLVEGGWNVSHLVRQEGGNGALLCALVDLCAPQVY